MTDPGPSWPLVVGVDGSAPSLRAVDWAADEADLRGVPLRLVHAAPADRHPGPGATVPPPPAGDVLAVAARRVHIRRPGLRVEEELAPDEPLCALIRAARSASLLVVGTRGRAGVTGVLLGSVALGVAARAGCPVVVLRGSHDNQAVPPVRGRIVVGVGEHPAAVRFAAAEARRRGVPLEVVRAWRRPASETAGVPARPHEKRASGELRAALAYVPAGVEIHTRTVEGPAREVLVDASHTADLLVLGAGRREGRLGRVTHTALHRSACPVAVVPHGEDGR
ncbi:universal stress protein [Streptomyces cellulosae]|uniref:universal stress protein n=1 Tax=Streptomyces sp. enrichment culture TaxID=1795815 RepID=UPI0010C0BF57|nr:universal stress protein [Streptomyces cellulosae]WTC20337.1 universal stress protein [Streptomyces cellulosae]